MFSKKCLEKACLRCLDSNRNKSESVSKNNDFLLSISYSYHLSMQPFLPNFRKSVEKKCRFYYYRLYQTTEMALGWLIFNRNEE